jgi:hypothetical protein
MTIPESIFPLNPQKPIVNHQTGLVRMMRKNIGSALEYLWELSGSIRFYKVDVVVISGKEKYTSEPLKILYIGHYDNYAFLLNELYSDWKISEKHVGIHSFNAKDWINRFQTRCDVLFLDLELLYCKMIRKRGFIEIPQWIRQKLEIPYTWAEVTGKFRKNTKKTDLRKVRKYNFSYRLSQSEEDFKDFYHRMYKPYLQKRFSDAVIIEPEWKVLRQCRKGKLMQIIREDRIVACVLLHNKEGRLAYVWVGVPDDIKSEILVGAFSALYYFTIQFGYENGCHEIDFLGSRPLLNDGLFRYKRKWGTYVQDSPVPRGDILIRPLHLKPPVSSFFANNKFIARDGNDLVGKILFDKHELEKEDVEGLFNFYYTEGLKCLKIYCIYGFSEDAKDWAESDSGQVKLLDLSKSTNPADAFCRS